MGMGIKDEHNSMKNRVSRILYLPPHCHHLQRRRILSLTPCLSFSTHFLVSPLPYHHHNFFVLKIIKIPCPHPPMNFLKQIKQVFDTGSYNHSIGLGIREIFISLQQNGMQNINERAIRNVSRRIDRKWETEYDDVEDGDNVEEGKVILLTLFFMLLCSSLMPIPIGCPPLIFWPWPWFCPWFWL